MTKPAASISVLRGALSLLRVRLVLEQIGLAIVAALLFALWLHVPDASAMDVIGSAVLALIVVAVAGAGESTLMLRVAGRARTPGRLLRGTLWLVAGVALGFAWSALLDHIQGDDSLRAGYFNSRFPHQLRNLFSYNHIMLWLGWMWSALYWCGVGLIAVLVFAGTASSRPVRAIGSALRSVTYWISVVLGGLVATWLTGLLVQWTPGHGLRVEVVSLALRLCAAILLDGKIVCLVLAVLGTCTRRADGSDAPQLTPAGTPDESQPRTVENP